MAKKEKEEYVELTGIFGDADDYHVYHMTKADVLVAYAIGFMLGVVVVYVFFRSILFSVIAGALCAIKAPAIYRDYKKNKRLKELRLQFKDLMEALTSSYSTGKNTPDAFVDSLQDMTSIYGEESDIVREVKMICNGLRNNFNIEQLLLDFAARSGLDDILSFANVFEVCNRQGSDLKKIVADTRDIINDKIEIEMEDIKKHKWFKYPDDSGTDYGFICPKCGKFVVVDINKIPKNILDSAEEIFIGR